MLHFSISNSEILAATALEKAVKLKAKWYVIWP